jgi:ribosome-associated heat shock protein Hsp15
VSERQRIDKWLWFARFVRTRTAAQDLAASGRVRVNKQRIDSASHAVRIGDVLTIATEGGVRVVAIDGFAERRGGAPDAQRLYHQVATVASPGGGPNPSGPRPTKRDRRAIDAFREPGDGGGE